MKHTFKKLYIYFLFNIGKYRQNPKIMPKIKFLLLNEKVCLKMLILI